MAHYNYREVDYSGSEKWIDKLEKIRPVGAASSDYVDIHFTKPKSATVSTLTHPHVTFDPGQGYAKTRWYIYNSGGAWSFTVRGREYDGQAEIAEKVLEDALALNWIRPAQTAKLIDDDGFETKEGKRNKKNRMQTTF